MTGNQSLIQEMNALLEQPFRSDDSDGEMYNRGKRAGIYQALQVAEKHAARQPKDQFAGGGKPIQASDTLIQEMEALRLEKPYDSAIERVHDAVLNSCIELVRKHTPSEIPVVKDEKAISLAKRIKNAHAFIRTSDEEAALIKRMDDLIAMIENPPYLKREAQPARKLPVISKEWCINMAKLEEAEAAKQQPKESQGMRPTEEMINRFLQWRLPENFRPDCGIFFDADAAKKLNPNNAKYEPVGTNLFDYEQAKQMLEFVLETTQPMRELIALPQRDWHYEDGPVLWWNFPINEPPYAGTPLDDDFPDYKTHWTSIQIPKDGK